MSRNERNSMLFHRWYSQKIVEFVGGPMHKEVLEVYELRSKFHCIVPELEAGYYEPKELPEQVKTKTATYNLMQDGFVIYPLGSNKLWVYVFSGFNR